MLGGETAVTKIRRMVMNGFKSFGKRTELIFGNDFNVILGPNGSGKSNVLDALCFVLGKGSAKGLRAEKSSNLIYNGGKAKKPSKFGEVSIYFDNDKKTFPSDEPIVKVTRVVKGSGQSVYKINNKTRTRQQVLDLLSLAKINPDGYNIILQGDIIHFVSMPPVERRQIVEEIAGISIYEEKKQKALSELQRVGEKLTQAEIILREREKSLKDLRKDRDQAMKYKGLSDQIRQNKASFLKRQITGVEEKRDSFQARIDKKKHRLDRLNGDAKKITDEISKRKGEIKGITQKVEEHGETGQVMLQREIEKLRIDVTTMRARTGSCNNEIARIAQRRDMLKKNLDEINGKISALNSQKKEIGEKKEYLGKQKEELDSKITDFRKRHNMDGQEDLNKQMEDLDKEADRKQAEVNGLRETQQELLREQDRLEIQVQTTDERIAKVVEVEKAHKKEIDGLKSGREQFKKAAVELNELLNSDSKMAADIGGLRKELLRYTEDLARLEAKNIGIQEKVSGSMAIKKILENRSRLGGVYGTVAELGSVNSKYAPALEVAAARRVNSIVVDDDAVAAKCIKYLKENKFGIASFLPISKIKPESSNEEAKKLKGAKGVHGLAVELVDFDSKFRKVFQYVFGDTLVVDNIETARRLGIGKARMVTLDGDLAETSGAMTGGFRNQKATGAFKEKELSSSIDRINGSIQETQAKISSLEAGRQENEARIQKLREFKANLEGDIMRTEKGLHLDSGDLEASKALKAELEAKLKEARKQVDGIVSRISEKNRELADLKIRKQKLRDTVSAMRKPTLLAELNTFDERRRQIAEELIRIEGDMANISVQVNDILIRDRDNALKILKDIDREEEGFRGEMNDLGSIILEREKSLKEMEARQRELQSRFKGLFDRISKLNEEINAFEGEMFSKKQEATREEIEINTLSVEQSNYLGRLSELNAEFAQYEGVELDMKKPEEQLKKEINDFEKMRENFGSVNMRALEIYDSVEKEYNSLTEKKKGLSKEKEDVVRLIGEIDFRKNDLFMNTFNIVNQNFQRFFMLLSTKGEATLELEDQENVFNGGVNVKVRLTGNKFLDIRSLSGGEKTMTALALIFAIQEHQPASFYVLDEVDAALDKHNSEKLAKMIRKYCERAQYIVISHNDALISEADILYGVSMNEHSLSNVVSLKI